MFVYIALFTLLSAFVAAQPPCPTNAQGKAPRCYCGDGFSGTILWSEQKQQYKGSCDLAPCPNDAGITSISHGIPKCECNMYYRMTQNIEWDRNNEEWKGKCEVVPCPSNARASEPPGQCYCDNGYQNTLPFTYDSSSRTWNGQCQVIQSTLDICPANAEGTPCKCIAGYTGQLSLSTDGVWSGKCTAIQQDNTSGDQVSSAQCSNVRREWSTLTRQEKSLYIEAVTKLSQGPTYFRLLRQHVRPIMDNYAHRSDGFFPWHRYFIYEFEQALRQQDKKFACVSIPYWDWTRTNNIFNSDVFNELGGAFRGCLQSLGGFYFGYNCVWRAPSSRYSVSWGALNALMSSRSFSQLTTTALLPHDAIHNNIGGNMGSITSCFDPIFMAHHSFVDYLWYLWSKCRGNYNTGGAGGSFMPGFDNSATPLSVANTRSLGRGYTFAPSAYELSSAFSSICPNARSLSSPGDGGPELAPSNLGKGSTQAIPPREMFVPSMFSLDQGDYNGTVAIMSGEEAYAPNLTSLKWSREEAEYLDLFATELGKITNDRGSIGSDAIFNATRATCKALGHMRHFSNCTDFGTTMCTCERELDSALLDPCTVVPKRKNLVDLRRKYHKQDVACLKKRKEAGLST